MLPSEEEASPVKQMKGMELSVEVSPEGGDAEPTVQRITPETVKAEARKLQQRGWTVKLLKDGKTLDAEPKLMPGTGVVAPGPEPDVVAGLGSRGVCHKISVTAVDRQGRAAGLSVAPASTSSHARLSYPDSNWGSTISILPFE